MTASPALAEEVAALRLVLAAEHAAVYGYGVLGARLSDARREQARTAEAAHRARRDSLLARLRERGASAPAPFAAYDASAADVPAALDLAVRLEEGLAARWLALVLATDDAGLRAAATAALQENAVRAASWRRARGDTGVTVAFPGEPE